MSKTGRFYIHKEGRTFLVEPISKYAQRNAEWENGIKKSDLPKGGAIHPDDSIITDEDFKNIVTLNKVESPISYITKLLENEQNNL